MKDRIPTYPGRVTLVPVEGQANTYDLIRADQPTQTGTPLNKSTLLKDATAELFGLTSDAVPDDALARIPSSLVWKKIAEYKTAGSFIYTVPAGVTELGVYMEGGGGSGGAAAGITSNYGVRATGGAAGYGKNIILNVTPGQEIPIVVGAGGTRVSASSNSANGNAGGSTSFNGVVVDGGGGGKSSRGATSSTLSGAIGGQGSKSLNGLYADEPIDNLPPYGSTLTTTSTSDSSGHTVPNTTAQIPAESQNAFDPLMVTLCAGGYATYASTSGNIKIKETVPAMPDGTKGGSGLCFENTTYADDASGNGNGGGAIVTASGTATSGAGSPGMVLIYKRGGVV